MYDYKLRQNSPSFADRKKNRRKPLRLVVALLLAAGVLYAILDHWPLWQGDFGGAATDPNVIELPLPPLKSTEESTNPADPGTAPAKDL